MLIKHASTAKLTATFGPVGALLIAQWPHGAEIRYREETVLFFDATGNWMVGFRFNDIILAAARGTPKQFHDEVRRWLKRTQAGETPPQREGRLW